MCPRTSWTINIPRYREETVETTVQLLMFGMENRYEFWLEQLKMELNFLGSAFLFVKIRLRLSKLRVLNCRQPNSMCVTVDFLFI